MKKISVKAAFRGLKMKTISIKSCMIACISILALLVMVILGCTPAQKIEIGLNPVLSISEPPVLGKPVTLKFTFDSPVDKVYENKEYYAQIELSPGYYEVIKGDLEQRGKIVSGRSP